MLNMGKMMKQVQDMQANMARMQEQLAQTNLTGTSGGGLVTATLSGKGELRAVKIDPKAVDPADVEMLEDLIVAAFSDAKAQMDSLIAKETEKAMGGLKLPPGMSLPF